MTKTVRVRVDAQMLAAVKRAEAALQRDAPYAEVDQSKAVRYLIDLGIAAMDVGFDLGPDGKLRPSSD